MKSTPIYTVSGKKVPLYFCTQLHQMLMDFQNYFTFKLTGKFAIVIFKYSTRTNAMLKVNSHAKLKHSKMLKEILIL